MRLEISTAGTVTESAALAFGPLVTAISGQNLLSYTGSLTTPPCAEGLKFLVTTQQLPLDVKSFNSLKAVLGFNSRFTQNAAGSPNLLSLAPAVLMAANTGAGAAAPVAKAAPAEGVAAVPAEGVTSIKAGSPSEASDIVKELTGINLEGII